MEENVFIFIFLLLTQTSQYYAAPMVTPTSTLASVIAPISRSTPMVIQAHMDDHEGSQDKNPVWVTKEGMNCFNRNGAVEIGPEPYSYSMTLDRCKAACRIDSSCEGIIRNTVDQQNDNGKCFLRKNLNLEDCKRDTIYSLYYILKEDYQNYQMHEAGNYEADDYEEKQEWTCTCRDFVNHVGYGNCLRKHPTKGLICYVNRPSTCSDMVQSIAHRGMLMSAVACRKPAPPTPAPTPAPTSQRQCCGVKKPSSRIVGGENAEMNEYPWIIWLLIYKPPKKGLSNCAGSLIASQWILTAHHCTKDVTLPVFIGATIGDHKMSTVAESSIEKRVSVSKIINHSNILNMAMDIALLKLSRPVNLNIYTPICLPEQTSQNEYIGKDVWVYGWGKTSSEGASSDTLQKAKLYVVSNTECDAGFSSQQINFTKMETSQICAGTHESPHKDSCQGDSGGPLSYSRNGTHEQIGIVSYGKGCATPGLYGVYSYVGYFKDWIENTINNNGGDILPSRC